MEKPINKSLSFYNRVIPPDPEEMNDDRSKWARVALDAFRKETSTDPGDAVSDLLADLMHWCDRQEVTFQDELKRAQYRYAEETNEDLQADHDRLIALWRRARPD